ncbi:PhoU domain-containing protein [Amycolatopsis solani]|uniref:PhoU domain-containing protein n=1 Tax=Amycolatopsis solani TaxID=3028615 RepID=UPI0025B1D70D|nr:PhoU domain-containing protein [Amycolatopsis sp. MEP2-6]
MPTAFQKELVTLSHRLADLCALVAIALEEATRSVLESDHTLGGRAREEVAAVAALGAACEDQAGALLALHAPREEEVKAVLAAVRVAGDLTRMGGLAREVADARGVVPAPVRPAVARLGAQAVAAARAVGEALRGGDGGGLGDVVASAAAGERELREWAGGPEWSYGGRAAVDVVLLGAVHARFAAMAARVARRAAGFAPVGA